MATETHRFDLDDFWFSMNSHASGASLRIEASGPVEVALTDALSLGELAEFSEFVCAVYEAAERASREAAEEGGE